MFRFSRSSFTNRKAEKDIYFLDCLGTSIEQDDRQSNGIYMTEMGKLDVKLEL